MLYYNIYIERERKLYIYIYIYTYIHSNIPICIYIYIYIWSDPSPPEKGSGVSPREGSLSAKGAPMSSHQCRDHILVCLVSHNKVAQS